MGFNRCGAVVSLIGLRHRPSQIRNTIMSTDATASPRPQSADANNPPDFESEEPAAKEFRMHGYYAPGNRPLSHPISQQGIMRQFFRVWSLDIPSAAERDLLGFILDLTVNWGKTERPFTYREIEQANRSTETRARGFIKALEAKGFIEVTRSAGDIKGMLIKPNLDWEPAGQRMARAVDQALRRAYDNDGAAPWPDEDRQTVAQCIEAICLNADMDVPVAKKFARVLMAAWPQWIKNNGAPKRPDAAFIREHATTLLSQFHGRYTTLPLKSEGVAPAQMRGGYVSAPTQKQGGSPLPNERDIIVEGYQGNFEDQEKGYSPPAGNEGPAPAKETSPPVRRRERPVAACLSGKEDAFGGLSPNPHCARPPLAAPDQAGKSEPELATTEDIGRTLARDAARQWPNAPMSWPEEQRLDVARMVAARWPHIKATPALAHRFAEWLVATWPDEAEDYPTAVYVDRHWQRLLKDFADHLRQGGTFTHTNSEAQAAPHYPITGSVRA